MGEHLRPLVTISQLVANRTHQQAVGRSRFARFRSADSWSRNISSSVEKSSSFTKLRFRIVNMTTSPSGILADLRALSIADTPGIAVNDPTTCTAAGLSAPCTITVRGTTLETPPAQPNGGGMNSTLSVGAITLATPLASGASANVQFLLGVQQAGTYRFFINVEAVP